MSVLNLLVVDDEPGIRMGTERVLRNFKVGYPFMEEEFSYNITEAETGEQAIEMIESSNIDIMLLDNKLPGMDGIEVLEYVKNKNIDISIVMITSYASLDLAVKATNMGAFSFVPKPFTPEELRTSIENVTKHLFLKRMTRQMREEGKQNQFQFLSVLSHELKSPLNAVEGYLEIILQKQVGDSVDDYKTMLERSIERLKGMRNLIMDLIDLTRIESGKKSRDIRNLDLYQIAKRVVDTIEPMAIQKNVNIHFDVPEDIFIKADSLEIEIILNNFMSNAVKYNKDGGKVFLYISKTDDNYVISIEDTGIGISEEDQKLLFQDFVRIKNNKTKNITGSGLGLSIAKKLISLYNGSVEMYSKVDEGTRFIIKLPINYTPDSQVI